MKQVPAPLLVWLLAKKPCIPVDLFAITLTTGQVLRLCSYINPTVYGGNTFYGQGVPIITRDSWQIKNTIEVPSLELTLLSTGSDYGSINIKEAIINGLLDGSTLLMSRVYLNPQTLGQIGGFDIYNGICGPIQVGPTGAKVTYRGANVRMEQNYPKNIYTTGCIWSLFGPGCLVNRSTYTFSGTVAETTANSTIFLAWTLDPTSGNPSRLGLGYITFTSGALDGDKRTIQVAGPNGLQPMYPFDAVPQAGDTFTVTYGCTKTLSYCQDVFDNQQRWRGFPYVPPAETTI